MGLWLPSQKPARGAQLNPTHPLAGRVLSALVMNEGTGGIITNLAGLRDVGAFVGSGVTWAPGGIDFAGGDNDYISIPDNDAYTFFDKPFTIVARVFPRTNAASNVVLAKYTTVTPFTGEWSFISTTSDRLSIQCLDGGSTSRIRITAGSQPVPINTWSSVGCRYAGGTANTSLDVFVNGVKDPSPSRETNGTYVSMRNRAAPVTVGASLAGDPTWGSRRVGPIEYIYLLDGYVTDDEIAWLHREPYAMFQPSPRLRVFAADEALTVPANVGIVFTSPTSATVSWDEVPAATTYGVEVQIRSTEALPDPLGLDVTYTSGTTAAVTWNSASGRLELRARVRAGN